MVNRRQFQKAVSFSKKNRLLQFLLNPLKILKYLFFTRFSFLIGKGISWRTNLFFGKDISGIFPDVVFSFIYLYGYSEEGLTTMVLKYLKPGMIFFDIGAHIGYETLLSSKIVGDEGKVFSFEPTPSTYNLLYKNTRKAENVITNNVAVWSKSAILNFFDYGPFDSGLNSFFKPRDSQKTLLSLRAESIKVPTISLDNYIDLYNIKPDFIKIDAESAEYDILVGMEKKVMAFKPIIVLEIGDMPSEIGKTRRCIKFLKNFGYKVLEYSGGKLREHMVKDDYLGVYDNLLFLPEK